MACLLVLLSCTSAKTPPIERNFPLTKVTDHVYLLEGPNQEPSRENQGFSNNPGFVLVRGGVVVVDPGASVQVGEMVLKKIASVTRDPVIAVGDTNLHGDHWLGNQAIKAAYPKAIIYAHPKMIEVVDQGVIFLGDIVLNKRIAVDVPEQGNTSGQTAAIEVALKSKASHFIPGHGSSGGREIALAQRAFLIALRTAVKNYYDQGLSDIAMNDKLKNELAGYKEWVGFDRLARLVNATYRQVETELF